jgi:perosamine synthetase
LKKFIPVNRPKVFGNEILEIKKALNSGWISSEGPFIKKFENNFSKVVDRKFSSFVSSGTAALDLAIRSLDLKKGDEVLLPSFTIISCVHEFLRLELKIKFLDIDLDTLNISLKDLKTKISKNTKALLLVHIYGLTSDIDEVIKICKKFKVKIIEDCSEQIGQKYKKQKLGSFGDISTFSFYANKHVTTGEGGMVSTNNKRLIDKVNYYKNLCFNNKKRFFHKEIGWNYRASSLQAAFGIGQLKNLSNSIKIKKRIGKNYNKLLKKTKFVLPLQSYNYSKNIYWVYYLMLNQNINPKKIEKKRDKIMKILHNNGIGVRNFFYPIHKQLNFRGKFKLPNTEFAYKAGFYIPSGIGIKQSEIRRVSKILCEISDNEL